MLSVRPVGECDATRIFLTHGLVQPHLESMLQNPPKNPLPIEFDHRYSHFQDASNTCGDRNADRISSLDQAYGRMYYLFNLTSDPYEMNNLDIADYPEIISHIQKRLVEFRKNRPPQQAFWMQLHQQQEWPKTFVKGGRYNHFEDSLTPLRIHPKNTKPGDIKPIISEVNASTLFIHPWYSDDTDPWTDPALIDGKIAADEKFHGLVIKLLGVHIVLFGILEYIFCSIIKLFKK